MANKELSATIEAETVITPDELLKHWQGHRRLTRKMIEAFPEDKLFTYSIGGMRPFAHLVFEFLDMTIPGLNGVVTGIWPGAEASFQRDRSNYPQTKADLLTTWDETTDEINKLWNKIPAERFQQVDKAFGQWEMPIYTTILYWIDNEIHHRGQGYVYLRSLGIEPPAFWDR